MKLLSEVLTSLPRTAGVYVLQGTNGRHYTGAARNLRERLADHHAGRAARTKRQRPLQLVLLEEADSYSAALKREQFLKSGQGRVWLKSRQTVSP